MFKLKQDGWDGNEVARDGYDDNIAREGWDGYISREGWDF